MSKRISIGQTTVPKEVLFVRIAYPALHPYRREDILLEVDTCIGRS